jgi:hypothetical protein
MPKGKSKLEQLPLRVRYGVYQRLLDGAKLTAVVEWLFAQDNDNAAGTKCAAVWTASAKSEDAAKWNCQAKLYEAYRSPEFAAWKRQYLKDSDLRRLNDSIEAKLAAGGRSGDETLKNIVMLYVERIMDGTADSLDVRRLVSSWQQLRGLPKSDALTKAIETKLAEVGNTQTGTAGLSPEEKAARMKEVFGL